MLTDEQIIGIRELRGCGFSSRPVAVKFGCSHVAVCRVWKGITLTTQERFERNYWPKVKKVGINDCWEWQGGLSTWGYGSVRYSSTTMPSHRVAVMLDGRDPIGKIVRHSCDNPKCVNPRHLSLGTHADNVADRVARKRTAIGTRNGRSKLNPAKVRTIRKSKATNVAMARQYKVDPKVIGNVKARKTWKHVT
jgi:hypothetical protein